MNKKLVFGAYALLPDQFALYRDGEEVTVSPLAIRLITYLAEHRDRTVPLDELRRELWGEVSVGATSLYQTLKLARRATGDSGTKQAVIKSIRGLGYRFVADLRVVSSASDHEEPEIVGRGPLLTGFDSQLDSAFAGEGAVILIGGEPGVGKTRLASELVSLAKARGARAARTSGRSQESTPAYWSWIRLFRDLSSNSDREKDEIAPALSSILPSLESFMGRGDPALDDAERFRLFDSVAQLLREVSAVNPLILMLDDLHAEGPSSLRLLAFIASEIQGTRLVVVGTYRQAEMIRDPHRETLLSAIEVSPHTSSHILSPLRTNEAEELIRAHLAQEHRPDAIARAAERSGGNPYFAIEIARLLSKQAEANAPAILTEDLDAMIPAGILQLLEGRLRSLSRPARHILKTAALLGRKIDSETVSKTEPGEDVALALEQGVSVGLVVSSEDAPPEYAFAHDLICEALKAEIDRTENDVEARHLRIAEAMMAHETPDLFAIAYHLGSAAPLGPAERTLDYLRRAGEQSISSQDEDQAWGFFRRALDIIQKQEIKEPRTRCELLILAGESAMRGPRVDEARGLLRSGLKIARVSQFSDLFCRAAIALAYRDEIIGIPEPDVVEILEEAVENFSNQSPRHRPGLLSALSVKLRYAASGLEKSTRLSHEAVSLAERTEDAGLLARVLEDASFIQWSVEDPERWIELNHRIVEAATEAADIALQFRGTKGLATGFMEISDHAGMLREMERCEELANSAPAPYLKAVCALHRASVAFLDGDYEVAEHHTIQAASCGLRAITQLCAVQIYFHRLETGRLVELEASTRSLVDSNPGVVAWRFALARILSEKGESDHAREQLRQAGSLATLSQDRNWLAAGAMAAESAIQIHDHAICDQLLESLAPHARVNVVLGHGSLYYGNTGFFVGRLFEELGRAEEAKGAFTAAHSMHERMGSRRWIDRTQQALDRLESR